MVTFMRVFAWICLLVSGLQLVLTAQDAPQLREERDKLAQRGMWRDAINFYSEKLMSVSDSSSGNDLLRAVEALRELGAWAEFDGFVETAVSAQGENAEVLLAAASAYQMAPHSGRIVGGVFTRSGGNRHFRGGGDAQSSAGEFISTDHRDRVRTLQLLRTALAKAENDSLRARIWEKIAGAFDLNESWKLQVLTPIESLPEWDELGPEGGTEGAPWKGGGPILFDTPASWDASIHDGERWRFSLAELARLAREKEPETVLARARFSQSQFGTETLAVFQGWSQEDPDSARGILEMDTLAEDECLARTSDGIRRFKLPAEHHFIAMFRSLLDHEVHGAEAGDQLVEVFLNRRQFDRARSVLEQTITRHGPGPDDARKKLLKQIVGHWGRFEPATTVPAGTKPTLPLVFRNASRIRLSASPVDMEAVLRDTVEYLKGNPGKLDWERLNPSQIAYRLISGKSARYIGKPASGWQVDLSPRAAHCDTRADLEVPFSTAGAWWITGEIEGGNSFHTLVWIVDSVIAENDVAGEKQWWVADAESGAPIPDSKIEFFGFRTTVIERKTPGSPRMEILTHRVERTTDADGRTRIKPGDLDPEFQWLAVARKSGRFPAFFGFQPLQISTPEDGERNRDLGYGLSDRPLYQPGDPVFLKFYLRNVGYFDPDESRWADQTGSLTVTNGVGEEIITLRDLKTDALGAVECEVVIPKETTLGVMTATYQINGGPSARVGFRVEEFRKPEYEVTVEAPSEPVKLGDKFSVTVRANYFHGSPVRNAEVEMVVKRGSLAHRWFPLWRWDWLYGAGAWWKGSQADWHPTWESWGSVPPQPPWWRENRWTPDEMVMKRTLPIGSDGTVTMEIDTTAAKQIHGDMDASYTIEARVVDASRREVRGSGSVIAARKPFQVIIWTDRGHTRAGESVEATVSAATLAGKPVIGASGTLKIFKLSHGENGRIDETEIQSWPITTDAEGQLRHKFAAPITGQYRLVASLSANAGETVEGAMILNVHGPGRADPADWKFGPLELLADQSTYATGDIVRLRVNSDRENAHVWLFLHVSGTAGREARRIELDGKSREVAIPLDLRDMPNMFIEGVTIHGAKTHSAVCQILLPPVSKMVDVVLEPAKPRVAPCESSTLRVTLRDADGKPLTGNAVLTIYDKSLDALAGGSNVSPIHQNFWSWKNNFYRGATRETIPQSPGNLIRPTVTPMDSLGVFGDEARLAHWAQQNELGETSMLKSSRMATSAAIALALDPFAGTDAQATQMTGDASDPFGAAAPIAESILVRKDFADLLKWSGSVRIDENGQAEIPLTFPDNLTTWKARVWFLGEGTQVGEGTAEIITSKSLLVRLQAPRFLVERDEAILSAVVQNDTAVSKSVKVSLEIDGASLIPLDTAPRTVEIAAMSEARVDWRVKAVREGECTLRMRADAGDDGDAVERTLPVRVHGMLRQDAWSRVIDPDGKSTTIEIDVPENRRADQSKLTVQFSPSIAGAVVDAIPYLASYPHGCTEQTLNRFVPAVVARQMLRDLGLNLSEIKNKRTNLNPQELGRSEERAKQWKQWKGNPVFDELEIEKMASRGVEDLMSMQNADGGWGWFFGHREDSYPHTTAVVVHGLLLARANGSSIPEGMLENGIAWLSAYERNQTAALQLHVERQALGPAARKLVSAHTYGKPKSDALDAFVRLVLGEANLDSEPMLAFLHRDRLELPVYAKCLIGLEHHRKGDDARRDEVMGMISQYLKRDPENQTSYLNLQNGAYWWNWYGSDVEAHAWYLKLLTAVKPEDPDTRGLVKYLVNNRKHATYWESTRDTAFAIEALASYFKASQENAPDMKVDVLMDGKTLHSVSIDRDNLFSFDGTIVLAGDALAAGKHRIELRRSGKGAVYANAYLEVFSLEDSFRPAGLEVKVSRQISKLIPVDLSKDVPDQSGQVVRQNVERFRRELLENGSRLKSGDLVEVELILESKNDYEYLIFSDVKAAGFEAVEALSGYVDGDGGFSAYMEPRDQTVDFFIRALPRGTQSLRYQLRAEAPGIYKALPATAEAMYAPELRANSADQRLEIQD